MSFPHRTAMYQKEKGKIVYPDDYQEYVMKRNGNPTYPGHYPDGTPDLQKSRYLIPLASTGLEDSGDSEIFEGHVLKLQGIEGQSNFPVVYENGAFVEWIHPNTKLPLMEVKDIIEKDWIISGHALTDPNLVPDSFDTKEYFDL